MEVHDISRKDKFVHEQCYYRVVHIRWRQATSMLIQTWSYDGMVRQDHFAVDCDVPYMWYHFSLVERNQTEWVPGGGIHIAKLAEASKTWLTADELVDRLNWLRTLGSAKE
ncbi:MAG TPA: hypothetical protein VGH74_09975 [Planctomycetaceae bacterium]|jgi:hypothetical protein